MIATKLLKIFVLFKENFVQDEIMAPVKMVTTTTTTMSMTTKYITITIN